jgi:hypothetical protein
MRWLYDRRKKSVKIIVIYQLVTMIGLRGLTKEGGILNMATL